jgi:hypothetical protein
MAKFNNTLKGAKTATVNLAGGQAYSESPKLELSSLVFTSFLKDKFYETERENTARLLGLLEKVTPEFAAKTAIYARNEFGMRSVSHLIAGEIALRVKGQSWTKEFLNKIVVRPDDVLEILAYVKSKSNVIPNSLKKGLGAALSRQDEYGLAKYSRSNGDISMVDAVNLLHPHHTPALEKLMKGTLAAADTWETALTQAGESENKESAKAEAWAELVREGKLGYMALIRNLRNILAHAPETVDLVCEQIRNEKKIKNSMMFPFRFITALESVQGLANARPIIEALGDAAEISLSNVPVFEGKTLVVVDVSGSMTGKPATIASIFAATLLKANKDADFMVFSNNGEYRSFNGRDTVLTLAQSIRFSGGGTNFTSIFQTASKAYDRVVILSDMQGWINDRGLSSALAAYKTRHKANPLVYSFDLNGYGTLQFPESNVYCLAGFSDKVFDILGMLERDKNALIHEIEKVEI